MKANINDVKNTGIVQRREYGRKIVTRHILLMQNYHVQRDKVQSHDLLF